MKRTKLISIAALGALALVPVACNVNYSANLDFGGSAKNKSKQKPAQSNAKAAKRSRPTQPSTRTPAPPAKAAAPSNAKGTHSHQQTASLQSVAGRPTPQQQGPVAASTERQMLEPEACFEIRRLEASGQDRATGFDSNAELGRLQGKCAEDRARQAQYSHLEKGWYEKLPSAAELRRAETDRRRLAVVSLGLRDYIANSVVLDPRKERAFVPPALSAKWKEYDALSRGASASSADDTAFALLEVFSRHYSPAETAALLQPLRMDPKLAFGNDVSESERSLLASYRPTAQTMMGLLTGGGPGLVAAAMRPGYDTQCEATCDQRAATAFRGCAAPSSCRSGIRTKLDACVKPCVDTRVATTAAGLDEQAASRRRGQQGGQDFLDYCASGGSDPGCP